MLQSCKKSCCSSLIHRIEPVLVRPFPSLRQTSSLGAAFRTAPTNSGNISGPTVFMTRVVMSWLRTYRGSKCCLKTRWP